jgi:hypothetical protein
LGLVCVIVVVIDIVENIYAGFTDA